MKIVLFGPPGAGKGTQAELISKEYVLPHISTGDVIRKNISNKTEIGLAALKFIECGKLVPDDLVNELLKSELEGKESYLLDGYPRTISQAETLGKIADIDVVLDLEVDLESVVDRIIGRLVCSKCGRSYHKKFYFSDVCECGAPLTTRSDDNEATVRSRLAVYEESTKPLIEFYKNRGKLVPIDGNGTIDEVFARIKRVL